MVAWRPILPTRKQRCPPSCPNNELNELLDRFCSDKGTHFMGRHHYGNAYFSIFGGVREHVRELLEIGIGDDLSVMIPQGKRHPYDRQLGPLKPRSAAAGLVVKEGRIVGQFGPVDSVQVTFSCSKSYLSAAAGLAYDDALFGDLDDAVADSVSDGGFDSVQNAGITWHTWELKFGDSHWRVRRLLDPVAGCIVGKSGLSQRGGG